MRTLLAALRGARLIATGMEAGSWIYHYLLTDGNVLEVVVPANRPVVSSVHA